MTDICHSGGCVGADAIFGHWAAKAGHTVRHYSFLNHRYDKSCPTDTIIQLNAFQERLGDAALTDAAKVLGRPFPTRSHYTDSLLRRNYWQIKDSTSVYAIGYIGDRGMVEGGTGWAVTMAILKGLLNVYLFDQNTKVWNRFTAYSPKYKQMEWTEFGDPPGKPRRPEGEYAGIGSHDITEAGQKAIEELYR